MEESLTPLSNREKMNYYICVRGTIQKFEELACKVAIEGGTLNLTVLSLSGVLYGYSFSLAALLVSFGSIFTSICFGFMARFYSKLLEVSVDTSKKLEDEILPSAWSSVENKMGKKLMGEKLTHNLDDFGTIFGMRFAGKHTWIVILLEFVVLSIMGLALLIFYLWSFFAPHRLVMPMT